MRIKHAVAVAKMLISANAAVYTAYRAEMLIWVLGGTLPLFMMFIWMRIAGEGSISGFDSDKFAAYFLIAFLARHLTPFVLLRELDQEIRLGGLSAKLMRPLDPYWGWLVAQCADAIFRLPFVVPITIGGFILSHSWTALHWDNAPLFALAMLGAIVVHFHLHYCIGLLAFWTDRVVALEGILFTMYFVLGGGLVPIALLPDWARDAIMLSPFPYVIGLPADVMLGDQAWPAMAHGLVVQLGWGAGLLVGARVLWRFGLRRYEAVGI